jgi:S-(2-succino)cysteine N-acetyltransferase
VDMTLEIRPARQADAERLLSVIYEAYETIRQLELHWPAAHATLELIRDNLDRNECYVLEADGVVAATVTLSRGEEVKALTDLPFLKWFAVDPKWQGKGYGGKLLDWVESVVIREQEGAPAVTLATAEKHPWLLPMYERRGYERFYAFDSGNGDGTMHVLRKIVDPERFERYRLDHPEPKAGFAPAEDQESKERVG